MEQGWIGVDLDGTLAEYHGWNGGIIGDPVPRMVTRVKEWLKEGQEVRIFTARVSQKTRDVKGDPTVEYEARKIQDWCEKHIGKRLSVTAEKDYQMIELWDDRCRRVEFNTGRLVTFHL